MRRRAFLCGSAAAFGGCLSGCTSGVLGGGPDVEFEFTYDDSGNADVFTTWGTTLRISHGGGSWIDWEEAWRVEVHRDGRKIKNWRLPIEPGSFVPVDVLPGQLVEVVRVAPDRESEEVLVEYRMPGGEPLPDVDVAFDRSRDAVEVTHAGGDRLTADTTGEVALSVGGERTGTWELPIAPGDATTVDAPAGETVRVEWVGPRTGWTCALGVFVDGRTPVPRADFAFDTDGDPRERSGFRAIHVGGDPLTPANAGRLSVTAYDRARSEPAYGSTRRRVLDWPLPVEDGDSVGAENVRLDEAVVEWTPPYGGKTWTLARIVSPLP